MRGCAGVAYGRVGVGIINTAPHNNSCNFMDRTGENGDKPDPKQGKTRLAPKRLPRLPVITVKIKNKFSFFSLIALIMRIILEGVYCLYRVIHIDPQQSEMHLCKRLISPNPLNDGCHETSNAYLPSRARSSFWPLAMDTGSYTAKFPPRRRATPRRKYAPAGTP